MEERLDPRRVGEMLDRLIEDMRTAGMHERAAELERIRKKPKPQAKDESAS